MCGWGERRYMASMSGFGSLRSSMRSISGLGLVVGRGAQRADEGILAMLWLRMSSSLMELSMIFLVVSSMTRTFH
jgi:hypothetical protein